MTKTFFQDMETGEITVIDDGETIKPLFPKGVPLLEDEDGAPFPESVQKAWRAQLAEFRAEKDRLKDGADALVAERFTKTDPQEKDLKDA